MGNGWGIELTRQRAEQIRRWRVEDGMSWRNVAGAATAAWCDEVSTNQLLGEDLCMEAAAMLGENVNDGNWN